VATINQRTAGQHRPGEHRDCAERSENVVRAVRTKTISKLYRSDDGGETWSGTTDDPRPGLESAAAISRGAVRSQKSADRVLGEHRLLEIDGWRENVGRAGAARLAGDDYQNVWINPNNPDIILLGSDQGAIVTVNGGKSWSSWYNQPTAQLYHVSADNAFPYRLYSGQQESGSVGIKSRGDQGEITFRDWQPVAAENTVTSLPIRSIQTLSLAVS
jgi:hypothetical protein